MKGCFQSPAAKRLLTEAGPTAGGPTGKAAASREAPKAGREREK